MRCCDVARRASRVRSELAVLRAAAEANGGGGGTRVSNLFELVGQGKERRGGGGSHYRSGCRTEAVQEENRSERKGHASTPFPGHPLIP